MHLTPSRVFSEANRKRTRSHSWAVFFCTIIPFSNAWKITIKLISIAKRQKYLWESLEIHSSSKNTSCVMIEGGRKSSFYALLARLIDNWTSKGEGECKVKIESEKMLKHNLLKYRRRILILWKFDLFFKSSPRSRGEAEESSVCLEFTHFLY